MQARPRAPRRDEFRPGRASILVTVVGRHTTRPGTRHHGGHHDDHAEVLTTGIPKAALVRWEGVGHEQPPQLVPELTRLVIQHVGAAS